MSEPERMAVEHLIRDLLEFAAESGPHGRYSLDVNDARAILDVIHAGRTNGAACVRLTHERNEALAECKQAARGRDELRATVERVRELSDEWESDHAKDDASSGGWFFAMQDVTEALTEALRDALDGGESDE